MKSYCYPTYNPFEAHENGPPKDFAAYPLMILCTLVYVPAPKKNKPTAIRKMLKLSIIIPYQPFCFAIQSTPPSARRIRMYATPQKMKPKKLSKSEDMSDSKSEKKGMTSAMMKAPTQVRARIPIQAAQPLTVCCFLWMVPSKTVGR